ncbi:MAG: YciI family protein [Planctomycetota bacterium]
MISHRTRYLVLLLTLVVGVTLLVSPGCARISSPLMNDASDYTFVLLKTGPKSGTYSQEESQDIFHGHMANMQRLADEGTLIIAGPFFGATDQNWRGLLVFDEPDLDRATSHVSTDPGIKAGVFIAEVVPMNASPMLREALRLEQELQAKIEAKGEASRAEGEPPQSMRKYVIVTADHDAGIDHAFLRSRGLGIIWQGEFVARTDIATDHDVMPRPGAVFVLDAEDQEDIAAQLDGALLAKRRTKDAHLPTGPTFSVDGWYATTSLTGLPKD